MTAPATLPAREYISVAEAAAILGVHTDTIRRAIHQGKLPASRPFGNKCKARVLIRRVDLDTFVEAGKAS